LDEPTAQTAAKKQRHGFSRAVNDPKLFVLWRLRSFLTVRTRPTTGTPFSGLRIWRGMPKHLPSVDVSLDKNHLLLTIEEVSGNIWVLITLTVKRETGLGLGQISERTINA
jgi:hypothetical protein